MYLHTTYTVTAKNTLTNPKILVNLDLEERVVSLCQNLKEGGFLLLHKASVHRD